MTRTLSGSIEDLGLDEIVRVIALSRRSGSLLVDAGPVHAELTFHAGRLFAARASNETQTTADLLVQAGVLRAEDILQTETVALDTHVNAISLAHGEPALAVRVDDVISESLTALALRVVTLKHGKFQFRVTHEPPPGARYLGDIGRVHLAGLDVDDIVREGRRLKALRVRSVNDVDASTPASDARKPDVYLVDDSAGFLDAAHAAASDAGITSERLVGARAAETALRAMASEHAGLMIVDLVMPRVDGRGILGGLALSQLAKDLAVADRVFLALEAEHDDARSRAAALGIAGIVQKPPEAQLHRAGHPSAAPVFAAYFNPVLERLHRPPLTAQAFDLARELRFEIGEHSSEWQTDGGKILDENIRSLEVLKGLLAELNNPSFEEEIPLLVLRFASAFFVRGALFRVDADARTLCGLGGFGVGGHGASGASVDVNRHDAGRLVHSIQIPFAAESVFSRALKEHSGVRQNYFDSTENTRLIDTLGGPRPREVYTAPLISPRGIEGMLYADNAGESRVFPDVHLLEIFLQQAAAALERADLKRQVRRLSTLPSEPVRT